jgi:RNA polymerase sigma-70 factor (ECF subfamily)
MDFNKILTELKNGNKNSFDAIFKYYAPIFKNIAFRYTKNTALANDILQESFIKIYSNINSFKGEGSFEGWMKRIVVFNCLDHIKSEKRYSYETAEILQAKPSSSWNSAIDSLSYDEIVTLIGDLPAGYQEVFNLNVFEGYAHKEIASQLGISESASRSQLTKAKAKLKSSLKKIHFFSATA